MTGGPANQPIGNPLPPAAPDEPRVLWRGRTSLAIDKPAGMPTTAAAGIDNAQDWVRDRIAPDNDYAVAVHRLDRDVSGVLLMATTKRAARLLTEQFEARGVRKLYRALVHGPLDGWDNPGDSDFPGGSHCWRDRIEKLADQPRGQLTGRGGREAITLVDVIAQRDGHVELHLRPQTGRMHQLRIQAAAHAGGIIGDPIYGPAASTQPGAALQLRAIELSFRDPADGRQRTVTAAGGSP